MRELMLHLPHLHVDAAGAPSFHASPLPLLSTITNHADETAACINRGLSAIGSLVAYSTQEIEDGTIAYDAIESLGWLLAELGAVAAHCLELSAACRQARAAAESVEPSRQFGAFTDPA